MNRDVRKRREELRDLYLQWKERIEERISDFEDLGEGGSEHDLFCELVFCLLTPQAKAHSCWETVGVLCSRDLLLSGEEEELSEHLNRVRFRNTKARNIVEARDLFVRDGAPRVRQMLEEHGNPSRMREWLVENVRGMGYKEASHFLRNVGEGGELAILDRHILRNMKALGAIDDLPKGLTRKRYLELEGRMRELSEDLGITMDHLDLLLWCRETGEIFK